MVECHNCAMVMHENATYIQRELPNFKLDTVLLSQANQAFSDMAITKHNVISGLLDLDEKLQSPEFAQGSIDFASLLDRLAGWMSDDIYNIYKLMHAFSIAAQRNLEFGQAFVLFLDVATSIFTAFNRITAAIKLLKAEIGITNIRPDYGLALIRAGVKRDLQLYFINLRIDHISSIGPGQFTTIVIEVINGDEHALSLDFNKDKLNDILKRAQPSTASRVRSWMLALRSVCTIKIPECITFCVRATLGEEQRGEEEIYVPLIIEEVFTK